MTYISFLLNIINDLFKKHLARTLSSANYFVKRTCVYQGARNISFPENFVILNERSLTEELQTVTTEEFATLFPQTSHKTTK